MGSFLDSMDIEPPPAGTSWLEALALGLLAGAAKALMAELRACRQRPPPPPAPPPPSPPPTPWWTIAVIAPPPTALDLLGLPADATVKDVRRAYHKLALDAYPDREGGSAEAFRAVHDVYQRALAEIEARDPTKHG
jgi:hypothetical protein